MQKKIVIAGSRSFTDYTVAEEFITETLKPLLVPGDEPVILSGKCRGADALGERYARERGWRVVFYPADWSAGRVAGPLRNRKMAADADIVICFWDGQSRGTASMIRFAEAAGCTVRVCRI